MDTYEYACTNGTYIVGAVGDEAHAVAVRDRNYQEAHRAQDRARYDYRVVRRTASKRLDTQPGPWVAHDA